VESSLEILGKAKMDGNEMMLLMIMMSGYA